MMSEGSWWISSKKDPRFDASGYGMVGMFALPSDAERRIRELEKELGCEAPDDLEFGYMKNRWRYGMRMGCRNCGKYFRDSDLVVRATYDGPGGHDVNIYGCPYCHAYWTSLYEIPGSDTMEEKKQDTPYTDVRRQEDIIRDAVEHPSHYGDEDDPYEAIKVIEAWNLDFCLGNVLKYISRAGRKDPAKEVEDLSKAVWYLNRRIEQLKEEEE